MAAPQLDPQAVLDYSATVERDADSVREQYAALVRQVTELTSQVIDPLSAAAEHMPDVCEKLEATFQKIDELNAYLDRINSDVLALHSTCRTILDAPTMREKASSFLAKASSLFGGDKKSGGGNSSTESGVWKRVPETLVVGGHSAEDFLENVHKSTTSASAAAASLKKF